MLFTVDVGNSHTVSGIFSDNKVIGNWRLQSTQTKTADELALRYHSLFQMAQIDPTKITGCIISSVVPILESSWLHFAEYYLTGLTSPPLAVSHATETGITICTDHPEETGADRIVNAVAAWEQVGDDVIVVDFGTAITFDCVSRNKEYLGGTIHPGIGISLDALALRTAKLPRLGIDVTPERAIGTSTVKAIHAGMLFGFGGLVDRMINVLSKEMTQEKERVYTIATGGMAELIKPYTHTIDTVDPQLTLTGLKIIYQKVVENNG